MRIILYGNLVVVSINLLFLFAVFVIGSTIISLHVVRKPTQEEIRLNRIISQMGLIILPVVFGIVLVIITVSFVYNISPKIDNDIANWITLTVEIGVGIAIALMILIYTQFRQGEVGREIVTEVSNNILSVNTSVVGHIPDVITTGASEETISSDEESSGSHEITTSQVYEEVENEETKDNSIKENGDVDDEK